MSRILVVSKLGRISEVTFGSPDSCVAVGNYESQCEMPFWTLGPRSLVVLWSCSREGTIDSQCHIPSLLSFPLSYPSCLLQAVVLHIRDWLLVITIPVQAFKMWKEVTYGG